MNLARFSVNRPVTAGIISAALFAVGLFYVFQLPVSLWPNITFPFVSVMVPYPGASPEQVEAKIVKPLEAGLSGIKGLKKVVGQSRTGYALMILEFRLSVSEREALDSSRERVAAVRGQLPQEAKEPVVRRVDVGASPILTYGIETTKPGAETRKILDDSLVQILQRIDGVNEARVIGVGEDRLELNLNAEALSARKIAPLDIYNAIHQRLFSIPWGRLESGSVASNVNAAVVSDSPDSWLEDTISLRDGRKVTLSEIGEIIRTTNSDSETVEINSKRGLGLIVSKRGDANTVTTAQAVKKALTSFQLPEGVRLFPISDQSHMIQENEHEVWIALFFGGLFAVLIILLFLTDIRSALISATALPVAVVGSFIFIYILGFSINMLTLIALALAIGLLIDDAVVVREAIYGEMEKGYRGAEAAVRGTDRVASAVLATTLAIVAVFVPVAMMGGMVGQFFREFGLTIVVATLLSMWVAFTLDPMLSSKFAGEPSPLRGQFWDKWRRFMKSVDETFENLAAKSFQQPILIMVLTFVILIGGLGLMALRGVDFLAFEDRGQFVLSIKAPPGMLRQDFQKVVREASERLHGLEGLTDVFAREGGSLGADMAELRVLFVHKTARKKGLLEILGEARQRLKGLQANWLILDPPPFEGAGMQAPVMLTIYGNDLADLDREAKLAQERLLKVKGIADARINTGTSEPGFDVVLNRNEIAYGVTSPEAVELTGRLALTGLEAGPVGIDNIPFFIRLRADDRDLDKMASLLLVPGQMGALPLYRLAETRPSRRASAIDREKRSRAVVLWATLDRTASLDKILSEVRESVISKVQAPNTAAIAGDAELFEEMMQNFMIAIIGAMFFIFVILAAQFENLLRPFVIILSLPLASVGAFLGLVLTGNKLALGAIIGILFLMGLAAKNGILLVDAIGKKEGLMSLKDAIVQSVSERCRPILMTSAAMVAGMIPTALMRGTGSEFRSPMAIAIIGGVISSTLLSLVVIPAIFGLIHRWRIRRRRFFIKPAAITVITILGFSAFTPKKLFASQSPDLAPLQKTLEIFGEIPQSEIKAVVDLRKANDPEDLKTRALTGYIDAANIASILAFTGGLNITTQRQWADPGFTQEMALPLPPAMGGPITSKTVILPTQQDLITVGAKIPLMNVQAIYGVVFANSLKVQKDLQIETMKDQRILRNAQLLLEYSFSQEKLQILGDAQGIVEKRFQSLKDQVQAGRSSRLDLLSLEVSLEQSRLDHAQAAAENARIKSSFAVKLGRSPNSFKGMPNFPFPKVENCSSLEQITAIKALKNAEDSQSILRKVQDADAYPTVSLGAAHRRNWFEGNANTKPQNIVTLELSWTLLDGGSRVRAAADAEKQRLEIAAECRSLEEKIEESCAGFEARRAEFLRILSSALSMRSAGLSSQNALQEAWGAGTVSTTDLKRADEMVLRANLGVLQAFTAYQGLALESLALLGRAHELETLQ